MSDAWVQPLRYNKPDVRQRQGLVASNGLAHDQIIAATEQSAAAAGYTAAAGFW